MTWQRVILETPYAGDIYLNLAYLRACMHECVLRGWSPYASHGLLTQPGVLRDHDSEERKRGIDAGLAWSAVADFIVVGVDLGLSSGMQQGVDFHRAAGRRVEELRVPGWCDALERWRDCDPSFVRELYWWSSERWGKP
jgi:hypothetical protein